MRTISLAGTPFRPVLIALATLGPLSAISCWGTFGDLDVEKLVDISPLIVEGTVVGQSSGVIVEGGNDVPYTVFELDAVNVWKGTATEPVLVTVPNTSRVRLQPGEQYLLFLNDRAPEGDPWQGHRYLNAGSRVWNVRGDTFRVTDAGGACCLDPITRRELAEIIEDASGQLDSIS